MTKNGFVLAVPIGCAASLFVPPTPLVALAIKEGQTVEVVEYGLRLDQAN